jgi:hypothetical protein
MYIVIITLIPMAKRRDHPITFKNLVESDNKAWNGKAGLPDGIFSNQKS